MSKKRTIMPNTKVDKNNIGKQELRFDEIYADNIITDKINNKKVDPDYYLKDNFTIIYPNGGTKEAPANITINSRYIVENPFPGYYVSCSPEIFIEGEWGTIPWDSYYASGHYGHGLSCGQNNDNNIILITGSRTLTDRIDSYQYQNKIGGAIFTKISYDTKTAPARIKIWKIGIIDG